jgi:hypothetical protein
VTDTNVFQLSQPGNFADPLTEVLRKGARALLAQAVEVETVNVPFRRIRFRCEIANALPTMLHFAWVRG